MYVRLKYLIALLTLPLLIVACGGGEEKEKKTLPPPKHASESSAAAKPGDPMKDWKNNKGIGPVKSLALGEIDPKMAEEGKVIYEELCTACHKIDKKFIGPAPKGILDRRTPEWIMNMILNPEEMIQKDPIAKQLLMEANGAPMANQNLTEDQARKVLEYFRTL
ncbi:Multicopper oxidase [Fulvivirga imtechensis AK7]|uniref:Multicopper oxidase n=1 Tax=Fulvivirga imtechensis AK7 TaxID=1237149 RepID=L8JPM2_9BACT|nr:cytochrome c [Fulvivirga imtechensis]ELR70765.1 Multicopper oxidase [Fulvivirga imtechensis AK7]